jgi:hypothetical protein
VKSLRYICDVFKLKNSKIMETNIITSTVFRAVNQYSLEGILINKFEKMSQAAKDTNTNYCSIANCCRGKIKTANNFIWKYDNSKLKIKKDPMDKLLYFL